MQHQKVELVTQRLQRALLLTPRLSLKAASYAIESTHAIFLDTQAKDEIANPWKM